MRVASLFTALAFAAPLMAGTACASAPSGPGAAATISCEPGSPRASCHTELVQIDRYCPAGTVYEPERVGWTCQPFSLNAR